MTYQIIVTLFSIINPFATIPILLSLTDSNDTKKNSHFKISLLASIYVFIILIISFFLGEYLINMFGISIRALKIGGGIVIASSGFSLLTGTFKKHKGLKNKDLNEEKIRNSEFALTPIALPMLAGPGSISTMISLKLEYSSTIFYPTLVGSLTIVTLLIFLVLFSSKIIHKLVGNTGINVISRLIGFLLISMGIESIIATLKI